MGDDRTIFVKGFVENTRERDLEEACRKFGEVDRCEIATVANGSRFAFVSFRDNRDAEDAVKELNGSMLEGRRLMVQMRSGKRSMPDPTAGAPSDCVVYIGGIDGKVTETDVEDKFAEYGKIRNISMKEKFCFVEFDKKEDAEYAIKSTDQTNLCGLRITAEMKGRPGDAFGGRGGGGRGGGPRGTGGACYNCGRPGHFARECQDQRGGGGGGGYGGYGGGGGYGGYGGGGYGAGGYGGYGGGGGGYGGGGRDGGRDRSYSRDRDRRRSYSRDRDRRRRSPSRSRSRSRDRDRRRRDDSRDRSRDRRRRSYSR